MSGIDIVVIGAGLYVCGKGTSGYGTILPAIFEWKRHNKNIGDVHCVSTSVLCTSVATLNLNLAVENFIPVCACAHVQTLLRRRVT